MRDPVIDRLNTLQAWAADFAACVIAGVVLGVTGPFGSFFNDDLPARLTYWMTVCLLSGLLVGVAVRLVWPQARRRRLAAWAWVPILTLLVSAPLAVASRLIAVGFWPHLQDAVDWTEWYGQTAIVAGAYMSLFVAAHGRMVGADPRPPGTNEDKTGILDRLPPRLGRNLLCLQMEDH